MNIRALTCHNQAVLVLRHFRDRTDATRLAADHGISRATAYRYIDEGTLVLADQAPDIHHALQRAKDEGLDHLILDGTVIPADRCSEKTTSVKGKEIDLWYSGKARTHGGNVQAVMGPDGFPSSSPTSSPDRSMTCLQPAPTCWARCTLRPPPGW